MGLFDGKSYSTSDLHHTPSGGHSHRSSSPTRSVKTDRGGNGYYVRPSASSRHNSSAGSFFGGSSSRGLFGNTGGSSSHYKRRPRDGYISYLMHKLQRMIKELWHYARRHPVKAFFAVVVPLLSAGGAIHGLMKQFGVKVPFGLDGGARRGGGGYYGSRGYEGGGGLDGMGGMSGLGGLLGGGGGAGGLMENAGSLMNIAKAFM